MMMNPSGMDDEIWIRFVADAARLGTRIRGALVAVHVRLSESRSPGQGPGVIAFERLSSDVCAAVRNASAEGRHRVIALSVAGSVAAEDAWHLLDAGAADVLSWQPDGTTALDVAERFRRWATIETLLESQLVQRNMAGKSSLWTALLRQVVEVAHFTSAPLLITGESGTGKELIARLVHNLDPRPEKRDLVILDCTTVVPELSGSEFFGHERGAFTGAVSAREGAFALADGGTLFLDEVGDLPLPLQAQLLRVVQEKTYKPVGGNNWRRTQFRLLCATHRDLLEEVRGGRFRRDLYYRIAGVTCRLPSLRDRREDIPLLIRHFMQELRPDQPPPELDDGVRQYACNRDYPGNVRDLRQLVTRLCYRHVGEGPITVGDIPPDERPESDKGPEVRSDRDLEPALRHALARGMGLKEIGRRVTEEVIRIAIAEADGNLQRAAQRLGVTDRALQLRRAGARERDGDNGAGQQPAFDAELEK